jgi:hypothetical protein
VNNGYFIFAPLVTIGILMRMMMFVPILYAVMLMLVYGSRNVWSILTSVVAVWMLFQVDRIFFQKFVSEGDKKKYAKSLVPTEEVRLQKQLDKVEIATTVASFLSGRVKDEMLKSLNIHALARVRDEVSSNFRTGASGRSKRVSLEFPESYGLGALAKLNATKMLVSERNTPPYKEDLEAIPQSFYTYTAWKVTQGVLPPHLLAKYFLLVLFQIGTICEIIGQFRSPDHICMSTNHYQPMTLVLAISTILLLVFHDVYYMMATVNLLLWEDHYRDFCGAKSSWYQMIFPPQFFSPLPVITDVLVAFTMSVTMAPMVPVFGIIMLIWVQQATYFC